MRVLAQIAPQAASAADIDVDLQTFTVDLLLAALLAWILGRVYVRCGASLSNRRSFAHNFVLLALTTCFVMTVIKTNWALSLGLVGALSIIRFRSAIKEPEELAYLFLNIAIGLGLGANARVPTLVAFTVIVGLIWIGHQFRRTDRGQNLFLTVTSSGAERVKLEDVVSTLERSCSGLDLRRFDEDADTLEACFRVDFDDFERLNRGKQELQALSPSMTVSFLENKGLV